MIGVAILAIVLVAAGGAMVWLRPAYQYRLNDVTGHEPGLKLFGARDTQGAVRAASDYSDKVTVLYMGYTHCPNVCPLTLARLHAAMKRLGPETAGRIQVLFVTLDPGRDTAHLLRQYVRAFDPRFRGLRLTGKPLQQFEKRYHVSVSYGEPGTSGDYVVNHSGGVFVFDRAGRMRLIGSGSDPLNDWVSDLRHLAG